MKKILCIALSVIMLTLALPIVAFAEENNYVCTISTNGGTAEGCTDWITALKKIDTTGAGNKYVVTLLSDVADVGNTGYNLLSGLSSFNAETDITIKSDENANRNYKISSKIGSYGFYAIQNYNLTLTNVDVIATSDDGNGNTNTKTMFGSTVGSSDTNSTTITFNNCNLTQNKTDVEKERAFFQLQTKGHTFEVNFNDCTLNNLAGKSALIWVDNGAKATINFNNTVVTDNVSETVIRAKGGSNATVNLNDSDIKHLSGHGTWSTSGIFMADGSTLTCNVNGNSTLEAIASYVHTEETDYEWSNGYNRIFYARDLSGNTVSVNLGANEDGEYPTLILDANSSLTGEFTYDGNTYTGNEMRKWNYYAEGVTTYNDQGASYKASAFVATKGIYLPVSDVPYYATTGEIATAGAAWTTSAEENTADVEFIPVSRMFDTLDGASLRLSNPSGIRFESEIDDRLLEVDGVTFGMLLAPTADLTADTFTVDYVTENGYINHVAGDNPYYKANNEDTKSILRAALTGIPVDNAPVNTKLSARAYIMIGEDIYYAAYDDNNSRSMYDVAVLAQEAIDAGTYDVDTDDQAIITAVITAGANA